MSLQQNIEKVRRQILQASARAGRNPDSVKLIAVSKTVDLDKIREVFETGQTVFGENRVQEAWNKFQEADFDAEWHLIGHLQTNKVKRAIHFASTIHSVDSVKLADEIQKYAETDNRRIDILLQVNVSGEDSKFGIPPENAEYLLEHVTALSNVDVKGLMTIAAYANDERATRSSFQKLRELRDRLQKSFENVQLNELSMGMTNDFEIAIEEGATMVRIGRSIFGERN